MGRRTRKVRESKRKTEWIFKIDIGIDLDRSSKSKVAFLSGQERGYYPEDPGHSKFGLVFQTSGFEHDTPPCTFIPTPDVDKRRFFSTKGYGIGGLSGKRFAPLPNNGEVPSPDKYQPEIVKPILELKSRRRHVPSEEDVFKLSLEEPLAKKKEKQSQIEKSLQCFVSFGTNRRTSRFGKPPLFNTAGVGSYSTNMMSAPRLPINSSFGSSPVIVKQSTQTKCVFDKDEICIECGQIFYMSDFYRTRYPVPVPFPETRPIESLDKEFPRGRKYVNLCNFCYHRASLGHSSNWPREDLKRLFQKTRTCAVMHKHDGLPEVINRSDCRMFKKLQRKELIFGKHFEDKVEESIYVGDFS